MRRFAVAALLATSAAACSSSGPPVLPAPSRPVTIDAQSIFQRAAARYLAVAQQRDPFGGHPRFTNANGVWNVVPINEWTSGFFPGTLWQLSAHLNDEKLGREAARWTEPLLRIPRGTFTHDLGFQYMSSFGLGYRLTGEEWYRREAVAAARLLAARFDPDVGAIKSWNWTDPARPFPVIVDNMMN